MEADDGAVSDLAGRLGVSRLLARVLVTRGLGEAESARAFLAPSLSGLANPSGLANLSVAAERIARAIREKQSIFIYGDYDADGMTATAILWHAIRRLGGTATCYIPHRIEEGYGLNAGALRQLAAEGAELIVSVDCGVTAVEPAAVAAAAGVELIITDHHEFLSNAAGIELPGCVCVVHPRLPVEGVAAYANPDLCGAGVAFKLAWGIGVAMSGGAKVDAEFRDVLVDLLALAALGTIADVVPLVGENRILAHFGLRGLKASKLTGIRALIASASLTDHDLDSYDVGFKLAPRLNASGRMDHAIEAVRMLTEADADEAARIASWLETQNRDRQGEQKRILAEAIEQAEAMGASSDDCRGIVLAAQGWHPGIVGIVASKIVERYHRPAILLAIDGQMAKGSGRSIEGFHLAEALNACGSLLTHHGGHAMAAGMSLVAGNVEALREAFREHANAKLGVDSLIPTLKIDGVTELGRLTEAVVGELARLGPFGQRNPRPMLAAYGVTVASARRVGGGGATLQLRLRDGQALVGAVGFGMGELAESLEVGGKVDVAFQPEMNVYNGRSSVQMIVRDVHGVG